MSSSGFGPGPKKETVYSGPSLSSQQGTVYGGPPAPTGAGTVYGGPSTGGTAPGAVGGKSAVHPHTNKAANAFFIIAGLSLLNTVLAIAGAGFVMALGLGITRGSDVSLRAGGSVGAVVLLDLLVIGVFVLIGVFARQGSGAAILIGLLLYAGDTVFLFMASAGLPIVSLVVHGIFLFTIFSGYQATRS